MTSPRKNADFVSAPVLFRLPNLHSDDAACQGQRAEICSTPATAEGHPAAKQLDRGQREGGCDTLAAAEERSPAAGPTAHDGDSSPWPRSTPAAGAWGVDRATAVAIETWVWHRWEFLRSRSGIAVAMAIIACLSWIAGRQMAGHRAGDSTVAVQTISAPISARDALQGNASSADPPQQAPSPESQSASPAHHAEHESRLQREQTAVASDSDDFYLPDELPEVPENTQLAGNDASRRSQPAPAAGPDEGGHEEDESETASPSVASQSGTVETEEAVPTDDSLDPGALAQVSLDALAPPANSPEATAPEPAAAETAAETPELSPGSAPLSAAPRAAEASLEPSVLSEDATDASEELTDAGEGKADSNAGKSANRRRVLSRTPHDIPDWSRYLPGANGSVRAASAEDSDEQNDSPQPTNQQAFYLDNE